MLVTGENFIVELLLQDFEMWMTLQRVCLIAASEVGISAPGTLLIWLLDYWLLIVGSVYLFLKWQI